MQAAGNQDLCVLDGTYDPVLDTLVSQASPTGSFKVMQVGALGKAAFHEISSSDSVPPCFFAPGLLYGIIDEFLSQVSHDRAAGFRLRASVS
jgi:hypothetical protein